MQPTGRMIIEYGNYALALLIVLLIAGIYWLRKRARIRFYRKGFGA